MPRPKICPLHKGEKPSDDYCVESACAWWLEWAESCAVPVAVAILADSTKWPEGEKNAE